MILLSMTKCPITYPILPSFFSILLTQGYILELRNNYLKIMGVFSSQRPHISIASTPINRLNKALNFAFALGTTL